MKNSLLFTTGVMLSFQASLIGSLELGSLPPSALRTIQSGRIAVLTDWLPQEEVTRLRADAEALHRGGKFSTDALASYGKQGAFDPAKDRQVLRLGPWSDPSLGDSEARKQFAVRMASVRASLAAGLGRPKMTSGDAVGKYGFGSTEISYTRFGAGASLKRHIDEHHEELKGKNGWSKPTRRSISWLVYLNQDWNEGLNGGQLRCFERANPPVPPVGATPNGDLQLGWLRPTSSDPCERPVFLDSRRPKGSEGNCALYVRLENTEVRISKDFWADPLLFVGAGDLLVQNLLRSSSSSIPAGNVGGISSSSSSSNGAWAAEQQLTGALPAVFAGLAPRFHFLEPPKSAVGDLFAQLGGGDDGYGGNSGSADRSGSGGGGGRNPNKATPTEYRIQDVPPLGGTLVLFDSVALPHEVLATVGRERFACSGWFHEDQQPEHLPKHA